MNRKIHPHFNFLPGNKKAQAFSLKNLVEIILAVIIAFLLLAFINALWKIYQAQPNQGTKESFILLKDRIKDLKEGESKQLVYYIDNGFRLVGFNKDSNIIEQTCGIRNLAIKKPLKCGVNACLALCAEDGECEKGNLKEHAAFEDISSFVASKDLQYNYGKNYGIGKYLVIYGGCYLSSWGIRDLTISRKGSAIFIE